MYWFDALCTLVANAKSITQTLHRWIHNDVSKRYSRLVIVNLLTNEIDILPTDEMVSHYVWNKNNQILAYCRINSVDGQYLFYGDGFLKYKIIAPKILNSDGHQHFLGNSDKFVTDTYPNRRRYAKLYVVDTINEKVKEIANVKSHKIFQTRNPWQHWSCDLHPRSNSAGNQICFDSVHTGIRSQCFLKLKK